MSKVIYLGVYLLVMMTTINSTNAMASGAVFPFGYMGCDSTGASTNNLQIDFSSLDKSFFMKFRWGDQLGTFEVQSQTQNEFELKLTMMGTIHHYSIAGKRKINALEFGPFTPTNIDVSLNFKDSSGKIVFEYISGLKEELPLSCVSI